MTDNADTRSTRLDTYRFDERDWENYDALHDGFEWEVPQTFNMATCLCDRWADDEGRVALYAENEAGEERISTVPPTRRKLHVLSTHVLSLHARVRNQGGRHATRTVRL